MCTGSFRSSKLPPTVYSLLLPGWNKSAEPRLSHLFGAKRSLQRWFLGLGPRGPRSCPFGGSGKRPRTRSNLTLKTPKPLELRCQEWKIHGCCQEKRRQRWKPDLRQDSRWCWMPQGDDKLEDPAGYWLLLLPQVSRYAHHRGLLGDQKGKGSGVGQKAQGRVRQVYRILVWWKDL